MSRLLTRAEAAAYLACTPRTLNRWRHQCTCGCKQSLPAVVVGTRWVRFEQTALDAWIQSHTLPRPQWQPLKKVI